jgi:hypothetical protein
VAQPTGIDTIQRWVPQDTATVTPAGTAGTVTFHLYSTTDCTGTAVDFVVPDPDAQGVYRTANTTITDDTTVSWKAEFDPDGAEEPSTGVCETATVSFDNDGP